MRFADSRSRIRSGIFDELIACKGLLMNSSLNLRRPVIRVCLHMWVLRRCSNRFFTLGVFRICRWINHGILFDSGSILLRQRENLYSAVVELLEIKSSSEIIRPSDSNSTCACVQGGVVISDLDLMVNLDICWSSNLNLTLASDFISHRHVKVYNLVMCFLRVDCNNELWSSKKVWKLGERRHRNAKRDCYRNAVSPEARWRIWGIWMNGGLMWLPVRLEGVWN